MPKHASNRLNPHAALSARARPAEAEALKRNAARKLAIAHASRMREAGKWDAAERLAKLLGKPVPQAEPWATFLAPKAIGNAKAIHIGSFAFVEIDWPIIKAETRYWILGHNQRRLANFAAWDFNKAVKCFASIIRAQG